MDEGDSGGRLQGSVAGSTTSTEEDQGRIFVRKDQQHDQSRRRRTVAFLVISISPRCNLGLFQSEVGSVWMCLNTGSSVLVDCKFGSEPVDEGYSEGRPQRISSKIKDIIVRGSEAGSRTSSSEEQQDQPHRRRRIKGRIFVRIGSAAGSRISSSEEQQTDHPRRHRGSRGSASSEERRRGLLHP